MKRLPSMIAPMLLVLAVLSTSAVKPVEYVRISPSRTVEVRENANRWQARCPRRTRRHTGHDDPHIEIVYVFLQTSHSGERMSSGPSTPALLTAGFAGLADRRSLGRAPHNASASCASSRGSSQAR